MDPEESAPTFEQTTTTRPIDIDRSDDVRQRFEAADTFAQYLDRVEENRELWHGIHQRVRLPDGALERARALGPRRLLAISEDWCGDAVNTLPVVARLAEETPEWELRVVDRDANPELMDRYLTDGSRSIPVVVVLDRDFQEVGWWGPRPEELQTWVLGDGQELASGERYKEQRRWYARDRGGTLLAELLEVAAGDGAGVGEAAPDQGAGGGAHAA